jgi:hypothetical protein
MECLDSFVIPLVRKGEQIDKRFFCLEDWNLIGGNCPMVIVNVTSVLLFQQNDEAASK